jgi:transcriptional regulator with XRE-family HTH domain
MAARGSDSGGVGHRVRAARERLDWSREALAFHAGISWSAIAQVESGRRTNLRPSTLAALSRALGVSIDYLVGGTLPRTRMLEHAVFPYRTDDQFQTAMGSFLADGLERSEATLAITTGPNIELLREHLGNDARSVEFLDANGFYSTPITALEGYRAFFEAALERGAPWVRVVGEPTWAGRSDPEVRVWTRYESLFNLVFAASPLTAVCPYDERSVAAVVVRHAHLTHPNTLDERGISQNPDYTDPARLALEPG